MNIGLDLLASENAQRYTTLASATAGRVAAHLATVSAPTTAATVSELRERVVRIDLDGDGIGSEGAIAEVDTLFLAEAVWFHDPGYLAHLNCPVALPAVAAETVLAAVNPSLDTWDQSRIGTEIERHLIDWLAERIGFTRADGVFTSGGSQSNLHALLVAREAAREQATHGAAVRNQEFLLFATAESHFSVRKSAMLLGLPEDAVVEVGTDASGRMLPGALASALTAARAQGRTPMAVVATAGTTDRGCIDPLAPLAEICDREGVWLHVDAAYGCGLLVSPTRRHLLNGIECARSVTADFHKSYFQPVSSSALLVRDPADLRRISWHADYLNPEDAREPNQVDKSLQTTRRFDALKLWVTLRASGARAIGEAFDAVIDLAAQTHELVAKHPDLRLVAPTQLSTVLFRWQPESMSDAAADELVAPLRGALLAEGRVLIAKTVIDGRPCNKLTLLNPTVSAERMAQSLAHICAVAEGLAAERGHRRTTESRTVELAVSL